MKKKVVRKLKNAKFAGVGGITKEMLVLNVCITVIKTLKYNRFEKKSKIMIPLKILIQSSHLTMDSI